MRLDDVTTADADWIATVLEDWSRTQRWSPRGRTPSPEMLRSLLHDRVAAQRVIREEEGVPVGVVQLVDVDPGNGIGQVVLLADPLRLDDVRAAVAEFVAAAFRDAGLRKLVVVAHDDELDVPAAFGAGAIPVGRLEAHERRGAGRYVDMLLFEIWRPDA